MQVETTGFGNHAEVIKQLMLCVIPQQVGIQGQSCAVHSAKHCRG